MQTLEYANILVTKLKQINFTQIKHPKMDPRITIHSGYTNIKSRILKSNSKDSEDTGTKYNELKFVGFGL